VGAKCPSARKIELKVHCFDNFLVNEPATADFIRENFGREVAIGASTRDLFDRQVAPIREMLEVHQGDFLTASWPRTPIELLLVDIAKSPQLWARVMTEMFPSLIPGVSLVVHQDYHHPWLPHIHIAMEQLHQHFELIIPRVESSAVFLCKSRITEEEISQIIFNQPSTAEQLAIFDRSLERVPIEERSILEMTKIVLRGLLGEDIPRLRRDLEALKHKSMNTAGIDPVQARDFGWIEALFLSPDAPAHGGGLDYLSKLGR